MQFIDKANDEQRGNVLIDAILIASWNGETYVCADYDTLCKPEFRTEFVEVLLAEQSSYCCYCLCSISSNKTTIEHIIPHKSTIREFEGYKALSVYFDSIIHSDAFDRMIRVIPPEGYPHDIAYYNLVGSCRSNSHCNHYRGKSFVKPLFYDESIRDKVLYDKDGLAFSEEYFDELKTLALSTNPKLIVFRAIWYKLAEKYASIEDYTEDDLEEIILEMSLKDDTNRILNDLYDKPSLKDDFVLYNWFFYYYKIYLNDR
jgi:hypothetical protein